MFKKLIKIICLFIWININHGISNAEENNVIPLKKPLLTKKELEKKVLINILKPSPKPSSVNDETETIDIVKEEDIGEWYNSLYLLIWFITIMSICFRFCWMLFAFKSMGLMVTSMITMTTDVINFLVLILIKLS